MYMDQTDTPIAAATMFSLKTQETLIILCALIAIGFGIYNVKTIMAVHISKATGDGYNDLEMDSLQNDEKDAGSEKVLQNMAEISKLIQEGASTFLRQEYLYTFIFVCVFAAVIFLTVDAGSFYTTIAFVLGATTSIVSGYIGMQIAVRTNVRTAKNALTSMNDAFIIAFRGGMVLGFMLVGLALLVLIILILFYKGLMFEKAVSTYTAKE